MDMKLLKDGKRTKKGDIIPVKAKSQQEYFIENGIAEKHDPEKDAAEAEAKKTKTTPVK